MSHQDDLPTRDQRRPRAGFKRLSGASPVDVSASLEDFIGTCATLEEDEPEPIMPRPFVMPEPESVVVPPTAIRRSPKAARTRARLRLSATSMAIGALLAVGVLLIGVGRSQGERPVAATPAPLPPAPPAAPVVVPSPTAVITSAKPAPAAAAARRKPVVRRKPAARPRPKSAGGIVNPFAD